MYRPLKNEIELKTLLTYIPPDGGKGWIIQISTKKQSFVLIVVKKHNINKVIILITEWVTSKVQGSYVLGAITMKFS